MAYGALTAFLNKDCVAPKGVIVTAVLPGGCPLACSFCIINQREERSEIAGYSPGHLTKLLFSVSERTKLGGAAVVGDEPLQEKAWPYAKLFLETAETLKVPTALITSGYNLVHYTKDLFNLHNTKILVSLDGVGARQDKIRGKQGAFARIAQGLKFASGLPDLRDRISIASILMPNNVKDILDVIDFAAESGFPRVIISPLLQSSRSTPLRIHQKVLSGLCKQIPNFMTHAQQMGVKVYLSDEFGILTGWEQELASMGIEVMIPRSRANLMRIDAVGRIETLASMRSGQPTNLRLPQNPSDIDGVVDQFLGVSGTEGVGLCA